LENENETMNKVEMMYCSVISYIGSYKSW